MKDNVSAYSSTEYDEKIKRTLPYYEEIYKQVIDLVHIHNSKALTWLDVGCGTGKMAEIAFSKFNLEKFVFCDCSADMIKTVKKRFDFPNADFLVANVKELEFIDKFDVVTAILVNHYLQKEERITAIKKCYASLKEGGMFISFENFAPYSDLGEQLYLNRWKSYQLEQGKSVAECEQHISRYKKDYFPVTLSEHLCLMENCGFRAVEIFWLSYMQIGILGIK